ncbi:MAG: hypothetical protein AUG51_24870 [Acidobacteria bacterium 13_1_20CM_3_53_8]|nr:MAG: hypothetical protein AUG51_24870 [Acidobacteria bacterium 13_1_20CM_3_53_8]
MTIRLAVLVSHPIQHFAPWHREVARRKEVDLRVFFYCDWGVASYFDPEFKIPVEWDIPLMDGYAYELLPIARRPRNLSYWEVDNPTVGTALNSFQPDVVQVFGYAHKTSWRAANWAYANRKPLLLYSDSNVRTQPAWWKRLPKQMIVRRYYSRVDGALYVGDNNREYHKLYGVPEDRLFRGNLPIDRSSLLARVQKRDEIRLAIRDELKIPQDAFVVAFCGKYITRKRPLDLVAATHRAAEGGAPVWSMLIGEGPERGAIEEYCRRERVGNTVMAGFVNQSRVPEFLAAADALAVTSAYDPHPLVVTEGACFGLPVIISDRVGCVGNDDTARPDVNALVYPCGDTEVLRQMIERLCRDNSLYKAMSAASISISETQDVTVAASNLTEAACKLHSLGPRRH